MAQNIDETMIDLNKYFNKVLMLVSNGSSFTFFSTKAVNKNKMDDILCCIEATLPKEYKKYSKQNVEVEINNYKLKSIHLYYAVKAAIQRKFIFSSDYYLVKHKALPALIKSFLYSFKQDLSFLYKNL